jgi:hypothetical protein
MISSCLSTFFFSRWLVSLHMGSLEILLETSSSPPGLMVPAFPIDHQWLVNLSDSFKVVVACGLYSSHHDEVYTQLTVISSSYAQSSCLGAHAAAAGPSRRQCLFYAPWVPRHAAYEMETTTICLPFLLLGLVGKAMTSNAIECPGARRLGGGCLVGFSV